jgi:hypothetical protein
MILDFFRVRRSGWFLIALLTAGTTAARAQQGQIGNTGTRPGSRPQYSSERDTGAFLGGVPPSIDADGYIHAGRGRPDHPPRVIGRASLRFDNQGRAWWHARYGDTFGSAVSPVRAHSSYDNLTPGTNQTSGPAGRTVWQGTQANGASGIIYRTGTGVWMQRDGAGKVFPFVETVTDPEMIVLHDNNRDLYVRIYADGTAYQSLGGRGWSLLSAGRWVR